jgi:hypothetical protein
LKNWLVIAICVGFLFAILPNIYAQESISSPLKQIKSGVLPQDVKCKEGFVLIIKVNGDPACVKPTSVSRLLSNGWITVEKFQAVKQASHSNNPLTSNLTNNIANSTNTLNNNNVINASLIDKWYHEWYVGNPDPNHEISGVARLPSIQVTPTISSTNPNSIEILLVGMSPNPLKVGDTPQFTLTYKNISDKPIYIQFGGGGGGCATPLGLAMSPSESVVAGFPTERLSSCVIGPVLINPNQIDTEYTSACSMCEQLDLNSMPTNLDFGGGFYQIMKAGTLHVTMKLVLRHELTGKYDQIETIQFDVNATS